MKMEFVLFSAHVCAGTAAFALVWGIPWDLLRAWNVAPSRSGLLWVVAAASGVLLPAPWGSAALVAGLAHTGWFASLTLKGLMKWGRQDVANTTEQQARLMDLRGQLARLHEQERMALRIQQTESEKHVLGEAFRRFDAILITIEQHLALGDTEKAERLITLFGKHLRGILSEASSPFIRLNDSLEGIRNYLTLMEALTDDRLIIDLDDGMIEPEHGVRMTRNLEITPWVESQTWALFEAAERQSMVSTPHLITADLEGGDVVFQLDDGPSFRLKLMGASAQRA
jgi:hypothetical protein